MPLKVAVPNAGEGSIVSAGDVRLPVDKGGYATGPDDMVRALAEALGLPLEGEPTPEETEAPPPPPPPAKAAKADATKE
jgi:hypothetical protein